MKTYTTTSVKRGSKVAYWNELHQRLFPLEVRPRDPKEFDADLSVTDWAGALFVKVASGPAFVERTAGHVGAAASQRFTLVMPLNGAIQVSHYGRDSVLEQGDFTLCDSLAPSRMSYLVSNQTLALTANSQIVRDSFPLPESVCGLRMCGARGLGQMLSPMLRSMWLQAGQRLPAALGLALVNSLLQIAATAYGMEYGSEVEESAVKSVRKTRVKRYIEARLRDPDLSVSGIARAMALSPRYLNRVFAGEESVLGYIQRRRLEECARQLADPVWKGHTATKIAFGWGFGSAAHFSRAFKAHFTLTPNEYRRRGLENGTHVGRELMHAAPASLEQ